MVHTVNSNELGSETVANPQHPGESPADKSPSNSSNNMEKWSVLPILV